MANILDLNLDLRRHKATAVFTRDPEL